MVTKTITEQRAEVHIFAGNDPAHTATGSSGISSATPALTPLMLDEATGKLVVWDGQKAGSAVGILVSIPPPIISWAVHSNTIAYASIRGCLCSQQDIVFNSAQKRPRNIRGQ